MEILRNCIQNHAAIFVGINILEFVAGLLLCLFPLKKTWQNYLVCVYGGFLFGMVPVFYISESVLFMLGSSIVLAAVFFWLQHFYQGKIYLPVLVVVMKVILIAESIVLYETADSEQSIEFFMLAMVLSLIVYVCMHFVIDPAAIQSHFILALFGTMEVVGAVLQFYRMDYSYFAKELYGKEGVLGFFLYILKVDYSYFDQQDLFVMGLLVVLVGYFAWKKIFWTARERYRKGKGGD